MILGQVLARVPYGENMTPLLRKRRNNFVQQQQLAALFQFSKMDKKLTHTKLRTGMRCVYIGSKVLLGGGGGGGEVLTP